MNPETGAHCVSCLAHGELWSRVSRFDALHNRTALLASQPLTHLRGMNFSIAERNPRAIFQQKWTNLCADILSNLVTANCGF